MRKAVARKLDPATLFERYRAPASRGERAELDAVAARGKALMVTGVGDADDLARLQREAFARGLAVVLTESAAGPDAFVLHLDQAWRLPALAALREAAFEGDGAWSLAAEAQASLLLGYTAVERAAWLADRRQRSAGYNCLTVYALLDDAARERAAAVGSRCFGAAQDIAGTRLFFHPGRELVRRDAFARVPGGLVLARAGLAWPAADELFGPRRSWGTGLVEAAIPEGFDQRALRTPVELLTRKGWA